MKRDLLKRALLRFVGSSSAPSLDLATLIGSTGGCWTDLDSFLREILFQYFACFTARYHPTRLTFLMETARFLMYRLEGKNKYPLRHLPLASVLAYLAYGELLKRGYLEETSARGPRLRVTDVGRAFYHPFAA